MTIFKLGKMLRLTCLLGAVLAGLWQCAEAADTPAGPVPWHRDSVFYHVYVRSFCDSDGDGNGDFAGLASKIEYIKSLGVDGVLLLPIFQTSRAGYAISIGPRRAAFPCRWRRGGFSPLSLSS